MYLVSSRRVVLLCSTVTVLLAGCLVRSRRWTSSAPFVVLPPPGILRLLGVPTDILLCLRNTPQYLLGICDTPLDRC